VLSRLGAVADGFNDLCQLAITHNFGSGGGTQPFVDAGDSQDAHLGAGRGLGVIANLADQPRAGPFDPAFYHRISFRTRS